MADTTIVPTGGATVLAGIAGDPSASLQRDAARVRIPFSERVPLDNAYVMAPHQVAALLRFVPADVEIGGSCTLMLIADGVHLPNFGAFLQIGRYRNEPGAVNNLEFRYQGGSLFFVRLSTE